MNKAYKVVFNKLRGTMMVVNEATSSIQMKSKTAVATAFATTLMAGAAVAAPSVDILNANGEVSETIASDDVTTVENNIHRWVAFRPEFPSGQKSVTVSENIIRNIKDDSLVSSGRLYGLALESGESLIVNGNVSLKVTATTNPQSGRWLGNARGIRINDAHEATFNQSVFVESTLRHNGTSPRGDAWNDPYVTAMDAWSDRTISFEKDTTLIGRLDGAIDNTFVNAVQLSGIFSAPNTAATIEYKGQNTKLVAIVSETAKSTAQVINTARPGTINFTGGDVELIALSPSCSIGIASSHQNPPEINFNNSGDASISSTIIGDGFAREGALGVGNINLNVDSKVQKFEINVIGSAQKETSDNKKWGVVGIKNSSATINSKQFNVRVVAGETSYSYKDEKGRTQQVSVSGDAFNEYKADNDYASAYGISESTIEVGNDTTTTISVSHRDYDAYGVSTTTGDQISFKGNSTISVKSGTMACAIYGEGSRAHITLGSAGKQTTLVAKANTVGKAVGVKVSNGANVTLNGSTTISAENGYAIVVGSNSKLTVAGDLTVSDRIKNEGTLTFAEGSTLSLALTDSMISNQGYDLVEGSLSWNDVKFADNILYDLAWVGNTGRVSITQKSAESLVESLPVTSQQAGTIAAVLPTATAPATPELGQIANAIRSAARSRNGEEIAQIAQIAEDLAPSTAPVVSSISQGVNNAIAGVANARLAANRAAGDVFTGGSAWAQMIYNSADQDATKKTAKLESDTYGITVGVDGKIGDNLTIGAGFGVTKTDAESGTRDIDVDSYSLFGYTEYNADNGWFVNGMATAIRGRYEENKVPAGIKLTAKYQTTVLGAGVATGYHFDNGISPEVGLRYLRTHQGSYNDGAQKIHTDGTNLLTASLGAKYEKAFEQGDWLIKPNARVAATYDIVSDDTESAIRVIGGGQYHVISEHQKRAAFEAGLGLEASNGDWDFSVAYNGEFRSHFKSHTGMIKAKYNF